MAGTITVCAIGGVGGAEGLGLDVIVIDGWTTATADRRRFDIHRSDGPLVVGIARGRESDPSPGRAAKVLGEQLAFESAHFSSNSRLDLIFSEMNDRLISEMTIVPSSAGMSAELSMVIVDDDRIRAAGVGGVGLHEFLSGILIERSSSDANDAHFGGMSISLGSPWVWSDRREGLQRFLLTTHLIDYDRRDVELAMEQTEDDGELFDAIIAIVDRNDRDRASSVVLISLRE